jgi:hypothetical protein
MILLTALRLIRSIWIEAHEMERDALRRFPHLCRE